jgi:hypothetical protein
VSNNPETQLKLIEFHWFHADRYRLEESDGDRTPRHPKMDIDVVEAVGPLTLYTPDPSDPIHRKFAELTDEPSEFIEFAESYGLPSVGPEERAQKESVESLIGLRDRLRAVIGAIDALNTAPSDSRSRTPLVAYSGLTRVYGNSERQLAKRRALRTWTESGQAKLTMLLSPALSKTGEETVALKAQPATLFDYMLLLTAFELEGMAAWRRCSQCQSLMFLGSKKGRRHKDTCSDRCRQMKRYRKQKELGHASQR